MSTRKGMNLKQVKNQLELLEGILEQDATSRCKNISSRYALRIAQACVNKQIGQKPLVVEEYQTILEHLCIYCKNKRTYQFR